MTDRGRWGQPGASAGWQTCRPGVAKECPVAQPESARRCVMGRLLLGVGKPKERGSPGCSTWDQRHLSGERTLAEPRGAREAGAVQVATQLQETRNLRLRLQGERYLRNKVPASVRVQAERLRLRESDCRAVKASLNSNCQKNRRKLFHLERRFTLRAVPSSTLSNSTNGWLAWQRRS
jgi:hypothetical protein